LHFDSMTPIKSDFAYLSSPSKAPSSDQSRRGKKTWELYVLPQLSTCHRKHASQRMFETSARLAQTATVGLLCFGQLAFNTRPNDRKHPIPNTIITPGILLQPTSVATCKFSTPSQSTHQEPEHLTTILGNLAFACSSTSRAPIPHPFPTKKDRIVRNTSRGPSHRCSVYSINY
jgi:hypothetical protein